MDGYCFSALLVDSSYEGDELSTFAFDHQATLVIPPRRNRKQSRDNDFYRTANAVHFNAFSTKSSIIVALTNLLFGILGFPFFASQLIALICQHKLAISP